MTCQEKNKTGYILILDIKITLIN